MRDPEALDTEFLVDCESRSEVGFKQAAVNRGEHIEGEGSAVFLDFVHLLFELGEHRLANQDLANIFDLAVDEVSPHNRFLRPFQKVLREEFFIKCRGYFRQKDRVTVVLEELMLLRKPSVHRMPRFMGKSEHMGKHIGFVVHQNIRRIAVTGGSKCSASFTFRLIAIDPTRAQPVSERFNVLGAERIERLNNEVDSLIETDIGLNLWD